MYFENKNKTYNIILLISHVFYMYFRGLLIIKKLIKSDSRNQLNLNCREIIKLFTIVKSQNIIYYL